MKISGLLPALVFISCLSVHADFEDDLRSRDVDRVRKALSENANLVKDYNRNKIPILLMAVKTKKIEIVDLLLKNGAEVDVPDPRFGTMPLEHAARYGMMDMVKLLIASGADPNEGSPLVAAVGRDQFEVVEYLLNLKDAEGKRLVSIDKPSREGLIPLHLALGSLSVKTEKIALYLLENGADFRLVEPREGYLPVHCAAEMHRVESLKWMLARGADPNVLTVRGHVHKEDVSWIAQSAMYLSLDREAGPTLDLLLKYGAKADVVTLQRAYVFYKYLTPQIKTMREHISEKDLVEVDKEVSRFHPEALQE